LRAFSAATFILLVSSLNAFSDIDLVREVAAHFRTSKSLSVSIPVIKSRFSRVSLLSSALNAALKSAASVQGRYLKGFSADNIHKSSLNPSHFPKNHFPAQSIESIPSITFCNSSFFLGSILLALNANTSSVVSHSEPAASFTSFFPLKSSRVIVSRYFF
jgi:hypothetical protein